MVLNERDSKKEMTLPNYPIRCITCGLVIQLWGKYGPTDKGTYIYPGRCPRCFSTKEPVFKLALSNPKIDCDAGFFE